MLSHGHISGKMAISTFSRWLSLTLSSIQDKTRLFLLWYCRRLSIYYWKRSTLFSKQSHFARNHMLSSWSLFMTRLFKLLKSSLKLFMLAMILSTRFFNESVVTAVFTRHLCKCKNNKRFGKSHQRYIQQLWKSTIIKW